MASFAIKCTKSILHGLLCGWQKHLLAGGIPFLAVKFPRRFKSIIVLQFLLNQKIIDIKNDRLKISDVAKFQISYDHDNRPSCPFRSLGLVHASRVCRVEFNSVTCGRNATVDSDVASVWDLFQN